jgi:hypothetical protein
VSTFWETNPGLFAHNLVAMSSRLAAGVVFVALGAINLAANAWWLRTGDVPEPGVFAMMRGGWAGFWFTTICFSGVLAAGLVLVALELGRRRA